MSRRGHQTRLAAKAGSSHDILHDGNLLDQRCGPMGRATVKTKTISKASDCAPPPVRLQRSVSYEVKVDVAAILGRILTFASIVLVLFFGGGGISQALRLIPPLVK